MGFRVSLTNMSSSRKPLPSGGAASFPSLGLARPIRAPTKKAEAMTMVLQFERACAEQARGARSGNRKHWKGNQKTEIPLQMLTSAERVGKDVVFRCFLRGWKMRA